MTTREIDPATISENHEFYDELTELFSNQDAPHYVPAEFPVIASMDDVLRANNIVGPLKLDGHPIRIDQTPVNRTIYSPIGLFREVEGVWVHVPLKPGVSKEDIMRAYF